MNSKTIVNHEALHELLERLAKIDNCAVSDAHSINYKLLVLSLD